MRHELDRLYGLQDPHSDEINGEISNIETEIETLTDSMYEGAKIRAKIRAKALNLDNTDIPVAFSLYELKNRTGKINWSTGDPLVC